MYVFISQESHSINSVNSTSVRYTHYLIPYELSKSFTTVFIGGPSLIKNCYKSEELYVFHPFGMKMLKRFKFFDKILFFQEKLFLWLLTKIKRTEIIFITCYCNFIRYKYKITKKERYIIQFDDELLDPENKFIVNFSGILCVNHSYYKMLKKNVKDKEILHSPVILSKELQNTNMRMRKNFLERKFCIIGNIDFEKIDLNLIKEIVNVVENASVSIHGTTQTGTDKFLLNELIKNNDQIKYYGSYTVNDISNILSKYQFGLVPFVINSRTLGSWPTKILEYLSCGLHVFST